MLSGLSLTHPAAMWALLSLLIPLLIHLFNRSKGRLVPIGHIDLVKQAKKLRVTEVKLEQWLLLLIRLSIFTLLALLLAGLSAPRPSQNMAPAVYLTQSWLRGATAEEIDALINAVDKSPDTGLQLLLPGFPTIDRQWLNTHKDASLLEEDSLVDVWPLLMERLDDESHAGPVNVYATNYNLQYGWHRPVLPGRVKWQLRKPQTTPIADARPYHAVIAYTPERSDTAQTMSSLLDTLKRHRLPGLSWEVVESNGIKGAYPASDWLILLNGDSTSQPSLDQVRTTLTVFADAGENETVKTEEFVELPFYPFSSFRLKQYSVPGSVNRESEETGQWKVILKTRSSQPLLEELNSGQLRYLRLNSRFHADWNSLLLQPEFPELFLQLMLGEQDLSSRYPDARINPAMLQNGTSAYNGTSHSSLKSLQNPLVFMLVFLWMLERWLSERRPRERR